MNYPIVSLIIPCYNMGNRISHLFDSIIEQTYKHLQIIIVDDGSTDDSKEVILSYFSKLEEQGYEFEYIYQENRGLGGAINTGLKHIKGDFFCWPDADDTLTADSVEKKLNFLERHSDYAFVRSDAAIFIDGYLNKQVGYMSHKSPNRFKEENLFEDYILERDIIFCPGCHMVRTSSFKMVNPKMDIFECKRGQNYQLLLPLLYKFKFGYIDECLYNFIYYTNSMSRGDDSFEKCKRRNIEMQNCILETLNRINMSTVDFQYYRELTLQKYIYWNACRAFDFGLRKQYRKYRQKLVDEHFLKPIKKLDIMYNIPFAFEIHAFYIKITKKIKSNVTLYRLLRND